MPLNSRWKYYDVSCQHYLMMSKGKRVSNKSHSNNNNNWNAGCQINRVFEGESDYENFCFKDISWYDMKKVFYVWIINQIEENKIKNSQWGIWMKTGNVFKKRERKQKGMKIHYESNCRSSRHEARMHWSFNLAKR